MNEYLKLASVTLAGAAMALAISGTALAQGPVGNGTGATLGSAPGGRFGGAWRVTGQRAGDGLGEMCGFGGGLGLGFVDEDGDGINDRAQGANGACAFTDADGDGVCDFDGERSEPQGGAFRRSAR